VNQYGELADISDLHWMYKFNFPSVYSISMEEITIET